jgi:hypothetical protein
MVKINNSFVLHVSDFGAIVDMVLAILALLGDGSGISFPQWWDYLYLNSDCKDVCHTPQINEQVPHGCHLEVILDRVILNHKNLGRVPECPPVQISLPPSLA